MGATVVFWHPVAHAADKIPEVPEFEVVLDHSSGEELGCDAEYDDEALTIVQVNDGIVARWNSVNPNLVIGPGDRIIEVNGVRGKPESILAELKQTKTLSVKIERAKGINFT